MPKVRRAYVCEQCAEPHPRVFISPGQKIPVCSKHGKMTRQPNHKYRGVRPQ